MLNINIQPSRTETSVVRQADEQTRIFGHDEIVDMEGGSYKLGNT